MNIIARMVAAATVASAALAGAASATEISFYYPIAVGGPIPKIIDGYVEEFAK